MCAEHNSVTLDDLVVVALDQEVDVLAVASAVMELPRHVFEVQPGAAEGGHGLDRDVVCLARHRGVGGLVLLFGLDSVVVRSVELKKIQEIAEVHCSDAETRGSESDSQSWQNGMR